MKKTIAIAIALAIGSTASGASGRAGFCGDENECINADRGAKERRHHPDAYTACAELAEYVSRKERLEWERCLAKEDRAIKGRSQR